MEPKNSYTKEELILCGRGEMFGEGNCRLPSDNMLMMDRIIEINDADGAVTLPSITSDTIGATYKIFVGTDSTDLDVKTDGTDKFVGSLAVSGTTTAAFAPAASNDVISMNGTTTGGDRGSIIEITAIATAEYMVSGTLVGSGTVATPFADS